MAQERIEIDYGSIGGNKVTSDIKVEPNGIPSTGDQTYETGFQPKGLFIYFLNRYNSQLTIKRYEFNDNGDCIVKKFSSDSHLEEDDTSGTAKAISNGYILNMDGATGQSAGKVILIAYA